LRKITLTDDIVIYQFPPEKGRIVGLNITVIKDENEYIIVDPGYERHLKVVLDDIDRSKIKNVFITHYHTDHYEGLSLLTGINIYGSKYASITLSNYAKKDFSHNLPNFLVTNQEKFMFNKHTIVYISNPGHSICSSIIIVDGKYMFVGDDLIYDNDGTAVIPFVADRNIPQQINGLNKILSLCSNHLIVPGHGKVIENTDFLIKDIANRIEYLNFIKNNKYASYKDFHMQTKICFLGSDWHNYNIG